MNYQEIIITTVLLLGVLGIFGIVSLLLAWCRYTAQEKKTQAAEQALLNAIANDLSCVMRACGADYPVMRNICTRYQNFIVTQTWDSTVADFHTELLTQFPYKPRR